MRGVLQPVLDEYGVGFLPVHGFNSSTSVYNAAQSDLFKVVIYVGDYDPSGVFMSSEDLPKRLKKYGGNKVHVFRFALTPDQVLGLPSFPASDKKKDPRYPWFVKNYGNRCWELDAMDPNDLRDVVERGIKGMIEPDAWERCRKAQEAEQESLQTVLDSWAR